MGKGGILRSSVFVYDQHPLYVEGLVSVLQSQEGVEIVSTHTKVRTLESTIKKAKPDMVVLGLSTMPHREIATVATLTKEQEGARFLVVCFHDIRDIMPHLSQMSPIALVNKKAKPSAVLKAYSSLNRGKSYFHDGDRQCKAPPIVRRGRKSMTERYLSLAPREAEVFWCLGNGLTIKETAEQQDVSPKTVEAQVTIIKKKVGATNAAQLYHQATRFAEATCLRKS